MANANVGNGLIKGALSIISFTAVAAATLGDIIIKGPWVGIACNSAGIGDVLSLNIEDGTEYDAISAVSGVGAAIGDDLFYNPTTGAFAAIAGTGYYNIGTITGIRDANNCFRFEKRRRWITSAEEGTITLADISDLDTLKFADLADVAADAPTNNDTLKFVTSTGKWTVVAVAD